MKYYTCFAVIAGFVIFSFAMAGEPAIKTGESLALERCIEIALAQHPSIMSSRYTVRAKESLLGQAKAPYYPKVDTQASFNRYFVEKDTFDPWFPTGLHNENIGSATLSQTIYDFGKTPTDVKTKEFDTITDQFTINDNLSFEAYAITLESALDRAYQQRPDLRSLTAQKSSAEASIDRTKRDFFPTISGNARYNFQGSQYPLGQIWNAGVSMNMNIFEGMLTRNKIEESIARTRSVEAQIEAKRLDILLDVKQSYLNLLKAKETISNTEVQIKQATENLDLANLRYSAGLADPLEVTDATVGYSKAKLANISALYDYKTAQASIERAMGNR